MMRSFRRAPASGWLLLAFALFLAACQGSVEGSGQDSDLPIPEADLSTMEPGARQRIEALSVELRSGSVGGAERRAEAFGELAKTFHAYKLIDAAELGYRNALELAPFEPRWHYYLGVVLAARGAAAEAATRFRSAIDLDRTDSAAILRLAYLELENGDLSSASVLFERVAALGPTAAGFDGLARIAALEGKLERAVEYSKRALDLQPGASQLHYRLGQIYRRMGDLSKASIELGQRGDVEVTWDDPLSREVALLRIDTAFNVLLELASDVEGISESDLVGFALSQFGDVQGAVEAFEASLASRDDVELAVAEEARIHFVLGALETSRGGGEKALGHYQTAVRMQPELTSARLHLATGLARAGRRAEALRELDAVLDAESGNGAARLKRAAVLSEMGRDADSIADLENLLRVGAGREPTGSAAVQAEARLRLAGHHDRPDSRSSFG